LASPRRTSTTSKPSTLFEDDLERYGVTRDTYIERGCWPKVGSKQDVEAVEAARVRLERHHMILAQEISPNMNANQIQSFYQ